MQVSGHTVGLKPQGIGGRTLRALTIALIVVAVLLIAALVLDGVFDVSAPVYLIRSLAVAFALLSVLLVIAPGVAFLIHSLTHRDEGVSPRLQDAALLSALAPGSLGVLLIPSGETLLITVGWVLVGVAFVIFLRALAARKAEASAESNVLPSGYSFAGLVLVLLAAIAPSPRHSPPYRTRMKSDLRSLMSVQESYFADHKRYTTDLAELGFKASTGVSAPKVIVGQGGWHATNTHSQLSNVTCGIAVNTTNPVVAAALNGEPACK